MRNPSSSSARRRWPWIAGAALAAGGVYYAYRRELDRACRRVAQGSRRVETSAGPIEYAEAGAGEPILVVHGAGGGFDQGLDIGVDLAVSGFRVIAPSRFGYLRTPLPADGSPEAQADAHAALLDALGIERAAVMGASAGAPSALQLAIRHPRRVAALILLVPLAWAPGIAPPPLPSGAQRLMFERVIASDFLFWTIMRTRPELILATLFGTPAGLWRRASAGEKARIRKMMRHVLPVSGRQAGLRNDAVVAGSLGPLPLERIDAPTLAVSFADDGYRTLGPARYTAERIHGGRFAGYADGGHLGVGRHAEVEGEIERFLEAAHA